MSLGAIFFPHGGIQLHTFVSYARPCQMPFCQTAPLLSSVARQQSLTEYWQEGSTSTDVSTTSASDIVGQHNKIGVINFGENLVYGYIYSFCSVSNHYRCYYVMLDNICNDNNYYNL